MKSMNQPDESLAHKYDSVGLMVFFPGENARKMSIAIINRVVLQIIL